jgi:hypothetical protein
VVVERLDDDVALEPGLEPGQRATEDRGKAGALRGLASERGPGRGQGARERREAAQLRLRKAVAARALATGAGRDPPPAIAGRARPRVRAEADAAGLEQPQRGDQAAEGLHGGEPRIGCVLAGGRAGLLDSNDCEERGLPR